MRFTIAHFLFFISLSISFFYSFLSFPLPSVSLFFLLPLSSPSLPFSSFFFLSFFFFLSSSFFISPPPPFSFPFFYFLSPPPEEGRGIKVGEVLIPIPPPFPPPSQREGGGLKIKRGGKRRGRVLGLKIKVERLKIPDLELFKINTKFTLLETLDFLTG